MNAERGLTMDDIPLTFLADIANSFRATFVEWIDIKIICATIIAIIEYLCGTIDGALIAVFIVMGVDSITGIAKAVKRKDFRWDRLRRMTGKWIVYLTLIILAHQASQISSILFWMEEATAVFIFLTEYKSVAENLRCLGAKIPLPEDIKKVLSLFKNN